MSLKRSCVQHEVSVNPLIKSDVESTALSWLEAFGWQIAHGPEISPGGDTLTLALSQRERESYGQVLLARRLRDVLLPKLVSGELRVKDEERFLKGRGL